MKRRLIGLVVGLCLLTTLPVSAAAAATDSAVAERDLVQAGAMELQDCHEVHAHWRVGVCYWILDPFPGPGSTTYEFWVCLDGYCIKIREPIEP